MLKMQFYTCVSAIMFSVFLFHTHTEAYLYGKVVPANPSYPGKCYDEDTKAAYAVGQTWKPPGKCERAQCYTDAENQFAIEFSGCGVIAVRPPCRVVSGNSADPYPQCCHQVVCN